MNILNRKLCRDIVKSWKLLTAVAAIIAVGIVSFISMLNAFSNLEMSRELYYSQCRMGDFWIDLKKAPVTEVRRLGSIPGIAEIRERISYPVRVVIKDAQRPIGGVMISMPEEPSSVINNIYIRSGSYFTYGITNQVIVSEKFARARNLAAGDNVDLIIDGQLHTFYIVGTAISPEFIYLTAPGTMMDSPGAYGVFFVKQSNAETLLNYAGACNSVVGIFSPGQDDSSRRLALKELTRCLEPYGVFSSVPRRLQFSNMMLSSEMQGLKKMATILPLVFLGVASLVLNVLLSRMAQQQRTIVGTLKALGYGNRVLLKHYLLFGVLIGAAGAIIGIWLGYELAEALTSYYSTFFTFPILVSGYYPQYWLIALLISLFFAVMGALRGVKSVVELQPAEAMHPPPPPSGGGIILERWGWLWSRLGVLWRITMRSLFRNPLRSAVAIVAALMGSAILLLACGFVYSLNLMVAFQFEKVLLSDYTLTLDDYNNGDSYREIARLPGVIRAEPVFEVSCTFRNLNHSKKGSVLGVWPDSKLNVPHDSDGQKVPIPPQGLLIPVRLAQELQVGVGDFLEVDPIRGGTGPLRLPITRTIRSMMGLGVYADYDYLNRVMGEVDALNSISLKNSDDPQLNQVLMATVQKMPRIQALSDIRQEKKVISVMFRQGLMTMAYIMILFAAVIFFGSILNGSFISLEERQQEVATLRVLGYTPGQVGKLFLRESMITNMIGTILGIPVGYLGLLGLMAGYQNDVYAMPAAIDLGSVIYTVLLALGFILSSHWVLMRGIKSMDWIEALNIKE